MRIAGYVEMTNAQERTIRDLSENVTVRAILERPTISLRMRTTQSQELFLELNENGQMTDVRICDL